MPGDMARPSLDFLWRLRHNTGIVERLDGLLHLLPGFRGYLHLRYRDRRRFIVLRRHCSRFHIEGTTGTIAGEAALKLPEGPNYDYFAKLIPPLRYCDAPFRVYPIVLSAPGVFISPASVRLGDTVAHRLARAER